MTGIWLVSYIALWVLLLLIAIVLLSVLRNLGLIYERIQQGASSRRMRSRWRTMPSCPICHCAP